MLIIEVLDDTSPGLVQGSMMVAAKKFADTNAFMPMDVDGTCRGSFITTDIAGNYTHGDWEVQRIE